MEQTDTQNRRIRLKQRDLRLDEKNLDAERLTDHERAWAVNVGRRLRAEFGALLGAMPVHERSGSGFERVLGVNRAVAYRVMSAFAAEDDLDVLTRAPGVEGMRMCAAAARRKLGAVSETMLAGVESAIDEFHSLIRTGGGSHARLVARIRATRDGWMNRKTQAPPGRREDVRRVMHDAIEVLAGRKAHSRMSISIMRPRPDSPQEQEYAHARAYIGYEAAAGGLPLVLSSWVSSPTNTSGRMPGMDYQTLDGAPWRERETNGLIEGFCSSPLPIATARDTTGRLIQILDQSRADSRLPMDVTIGYHLPRVGPIPRLEDPPIFLEATNISVPVEQLVSDLYVHRSLAVGCTPSVNLYLGRGPGGCDLIDRWYEQIDGPPVLGLLGQGIRNAHAPAWERHAELTRHVFEQLGWDPNEYVGYRCEERWPLWNCDYVIALDYRADPGAPSSD